MKMPTYRLRKGFSLIELLIVITIIAVLAAASHLAIIGTIKRAKIEEGNKMAKDLVFAIEQFERKYEYLPYVSSNSNIVEYTTDNGDLLKVLMGQNDTINPNRTVFFETDIASSSNVNGLIFEGGGDTPSKLIDPFGNPYTILIDYTGERKIDLAGTKFSGHTDKDGTPLVIRSQSAIAGSQGPDQVFYGSSAENVNDDVKSW